MIVIRMRCSDGGYRAAYVDAASVAVLAPFVQPVAPPGEQPPPGPPGTGPEGDTVITLKSGAGMLVADNIDELAIDIDEELALSQVRFTPAEYTVREMRDD